MDTEIRNIFEEAIEAENPAEIPETPDQPEPEERIARERQQAVLDYAIASAVKGSGTRDPELLELLLRQAEITMEDGEVTGLGEAVDALRKNRPYLFSDGGSRPVFAAETHGRSLSHEDEVVAQRYKNNPWYRR